MATLGSLVVRVGADITNFTSDMNRASKISKKNSDAILKSMKIMGAAIVAGLGVAVNEAIKFETAMAEVKTLLNDTSSVDTMVAAMVELSKQFGTTQVQQAQALYQIISAGASAGADAIELLTAANRLAVGGVTDVKIAADGLTGVLNAYSLSADSAAYVSDVMFTTMKLGKTTIEEISSKVNELTPLAAKLGISFEEVGAVLAATTAITGNTSIATTQLKQVLSAILAPAEKSKAMYKDLGIVFGATGIELQEGLIPYLKDMIKKTGGSTVKLKKLVGSVEGVQAVLALATDDFSKVNAALKAMETATGATDAAFSEMADTAQFKFKQLKAEANALTIELGNKLLPVINDLLDIWLGFGRADPFVQSLKSARVAAMDLGDALRNSTGMDDFADMIENNRDAWVGLDAQIFAAEEKLVRTIYLFGENSRKAFALREEIEGLKESQRLLVAQIQAANDAMTTENQITEIAVTAKRVLVGETQTLIEYQEKLREKYGSTINSLLPLVALNNNYSEQTAVLSKLLKSGAISQDEFNNAMANATTAFENAEYAAWLLENGLEEIIVTAERMPDVAQKAATGIQTPMEGVAAVLENTFKRLDDIFANMWSSLIKDGKFSFKTIKDAFLDMVAQMLHAAITQPIVLQITAAMTGGLASGAASAAGGLFGAGGVSGMVSGITAWAGSGVGIASISAIVGGLVNGTNGAIGAGAGAAIGMILMQGSWIAGPIAGAIGAAIGLAISFLFGGKKPKIAAGGENTFNKKRDLEFFESLFGGVYVGKTKGGMDEQVADFGEAIVAFDNALAAFMTEDQIGRIAEAMKGWKLKLKGSAISIEEMLGGRFEVILNTFSDSVKAYVNTFDGVEAQADALAQYVSAMNALGSSLSAFINNPAVSKFENIDLLSSTEQMAEITTSLIDAFSGFGNTPDELNNINQLIQARYENEIEMLTAIDALIDGISKSIQAQRDDVQDAVDAANGVVKEDETFVEVMAAANELRGLISTAGSPEEVAKIVSTIQSMIGDAYGKLTPYWQKERANWMMIMLDALEKQSTTRLNVLAEEVMSDGEFLREQAKLFAEKFDISLTPVINSSDAVSDAISDQTDELVAVIDEGNKSGAETSENISEFTRAFRAWMDSEQRTGSP